MFFSSPVSNSNLLLVQITQRFGRENGVVCVSAGAVNGFVAFVRYGKQLLGDISRVREGNAELVRVVLGERSSGELLPKERT